MKQRYSKNQGWLKKNFEKLSITKVKIVERKKFEKFNKGITKIEFVYKKLKIGVTKTKVV